MMWGLGGAGIQMALKAVRQYEIIKDVNRQGGKRPESFSILRSSEAGGKMREENP